MEQAAEIIGTGGTVAKIDVDQNGAAAQSFGIRGIPALLVVKNGKQVAQIQPGSAEDIAAAYRKHL